VEDVTREVVIAGGGFGGFYAARTLERALDPDSARVTLVSDVNFLLFTPLLPAAAAGTLEPRHVVVPLREQLKRTELRIGRVVGADPRRNRLLIDSFGTDRDEAAGDGQSGGSPPGGGHGELRYDQLIVALGSVARTFPVPGLVEHAIGFKTLADAIALRNRVIFMLETAEAIADARVRAEHLTFVFVGAGYTGVEGLAELQDFMGDVIGLYPRCSAQGMRWVLVEARERIMPEIAPSLAEFARRELRGRGIEIRTGTTIARVTGRSVQLSDGVRIGARTVVWTAGVWPVCRSPTAGGSRSTMRCGCAIIRTCGRSATRRRSPTRRAQEPPARPRPSTRSARAGAWRATSWRSSAQAERCGRSPTGRSACSSTSAATRPW
jgi:NADH dehydrogenase